MCSRSENDGQTLQRIADRQFWASKRQLAGYFLPLGRKPGTLPDSTVCQNFDDTFL